MVYTEIMMILQTMMILRTNNKLSRSRGFTLFELITVLLIISAMAMAVVPYVTRSNSNLATREQGLNMAEAIKYAIDLAGDTKRPTRIVINLQKKSYVIETASGVNNQDYQQVQDLQGAAGCLGESVAIVDMEGFGVEGKNCQLIFDPARLWPDASFSLSTGEAIETIKIRGKRVEIEESTI